MERRLSVSPLSLLSQGRLAVGWRSVETVGRRSREAAGFRGGRAARSLRPETLVDKENGQPELPGVEMDGLKWRGPARIAVACQIRGGRVR